MKRKLTHEEWVKVAKQTKKIQAEIITLARMLQPVPKTKIRKVQVVWDKMCSCKSELENVFYTQCPETATTAVFYGDDDSK